MPRQVQYASLDDRSDKEKLAVTQIWARQRGGARCHQNLITDVTKEKLDITKKNVRCHQK